MELIRDVDVAKVRTLPDLSALADIYAANGYSEEAYHTLKRVYEKTRTRRVIYQLAVMSVKLQATAEAELYYREFLMVAPEDPDQYVLRFLIDRLEKKELTEQIASLVKLKEHEYVEEWAYELAKLYQKAGMEEKCIRECQDIELWFGSGPVVEKAIRLREKLRPEERAVTAPVATPPSVMELAVDEPTLELPVIDLSELEGWSENEITLPETGEAETVEEEKKAEVDESAPVEEEADDVEQLVFHFDADMNWQPEPYEEPVPLAADVPQPEAEPEGREISEPEVAEQAVEQPQQTEVPEMAAEAQKTEELEDVLVNAAIRQLEEDDYIVTSAHLPWIQGLADDIRKQYKREKRQMEQMQEWICLVIDRAERRNMKRLLDIVNNSSYQESGLLELTQEDFQIR